MGHERTMRPPAWSVGKVTNEVLASKHARRRAALPTEQPILGALRPEAQARLFDFSTELRVRNQLRERKWTTSERNYARARSDRLLGDPRISSAPSPDR